MVTGTPKTSFSKHAATVSLIAPLLSLLSGIYLQMQLRGHGDGMVILGCISVVLLVAGLLAGLVALLAARQNGPGGVRGMALAGVLINSLLLLGVCVYLPRMVPNWRTTVAAAMAPMLHRAATQMPEPDAAAQAKPHEPTKEPTKLDRTIPGSLVLRGSPRADADQSGGETNLHLQMIICSTKRPCALIGNETVAVGDVLAGFKILGIEMDGISVQSPAGMKKLVHLGGTLD